MKLSCDIVRDLLPTYVDGLAGEETAAAVEAHIATCPDCAQALDTMRAPERRQRPEQKEVDYLKKQRRKRWLYALLCVIVVLGVLVALAAAKDYKVYRLGTAMEETGYITTISAGDQITTPALVCAVTEEDGLWLNGSIQTGEAYARMTADVKDGVMDISVYTAPKRDDNSGVIRERLIPDTGVSTIRVEGVVVWQDGVSISRGTVEAFEEWTEAKEEGLSSEERFFILDRTLGLYALFEYGDHESEIESRNTFFTSNNEKHWGIMVDAECKNRDEYIRDLETLAMLALALEGDCQTVTTVNVNYDYTEENPFPETEYVRYIIDEIDGEDIFGYQLVDPETGEGNGGFMDANWEFHTYTKADAESFFGFELDGGATTVVEFQRILDCLNLRNGVDARFLLDDSCDFTEQRTKAYIYIFHGGVEGVEAVDLNLWKKYTFEECIYATNPVLRFELPEYQRGYTDLYGSNGFLLTIKGADGGPWRLTTENLELLPGRCYYYILSGDMASGFTLIPA